VLASDKDKPSAALKEAPSLTATVRDGSGMMLVAAGESLRRDRTREMVQRKKVECAAQ